MDCRTGRGQHEATINVTPLVDVVLVLLIILMVVVPMTLAGYDLVIPRATVEPLEASADPPVLVLRLADCPAAARMPAAPGPPEPCNVGIDGKTLPVEGLSERLAATFEARPLEARVLAVDAEGGMNYEAVLRVVDLAQSSVPGLRIAFTP